MKKLFFVLLVLAAFFISCDNNDMDKEVNPFIGTWNRDLGNHQIVFTKNDVTSYYPIGTISFKGTYTYNDTHLTIEFEYREPAIQDIDNPVIWPYEIEDARLTIGYMIFSKAD